MRLLINADDFGWDETCSKAIVDAFNKRYITTTTACGNGDYLEQALALVKGTEYESCIGVHLVLTEGRPLTKRMRGCKTFCGDGVFHYGFSRYKVLSKDDQRAVYEEFSEQIKMIRSFGFHIHHIDSHHHIHNAPNIFPIVMRIAKEHNIPGVRIFRNCGRMNLAKKAVKNAYNGIIDYSGLRYSDYFGSFDDLHYFKSIKDNSIMEIMCHPDFDDNGLLIDRSNEALYDKPYGTELKQLMKAIEDAGLIKEH